ncbi:mechanosensitive ion channel family protein [Thermus thermophilus]|uniref:mechanosensitive ion channel family protein n=1 Tax=Thermus thermophilus TaxID=274 RepID=UPI001FCB7A00|nr:mechanosensitive ion channel family protein [Thermus thermophilus]BDG24664.1 mechanosensitive ion channel protein MscS [Thermus thermophilus]
MLAALHIALTLAAVVLLGRLGARLLGRLAALTPSTRDDAFFRLLGYAWWGVVAVAGASYLSHALSLPYEPLATWGRSLVAWLGGKGVAGGVVLLATWTAYRLVPLLLQSLPLPETEGELTRQAVRAKTLRNVSESALKVAVVTVGGLLFLSNLGLNVTALLAGAGVAGLAVSFAAQNLIRDFIHGFFILLEDQYGVGDIVKVGDLAGVVEKFNLRLTVLRDLEGKAHFIPNSQIQQVTVFTQEWSRAVVDVGVAYKEDVDRVLAIFRDEAERFFQDPEWQDKLTNPPEVLGVENLADSAVVIRTLFGTKPAQQWAVAREFRRRIKKRLDQEGVEIPFPHRTLYFGEPLRVVKETP